MHGVIMKMLHMLFIFAMLHLLFKPAVDHFVAFSVVLSSGLPYLCVGMEFLLFKCSMCPEIRGGKVWILGWVFFECSTSVRQYQYCHSDNMWSLNILKETPLVTLRTWIFLKCVLKRGFSCLVLYLLFIVSYCGTHC